IPLAEPRSHIDAKCGRRAFLAPTFAHSSGTNQLPAVALGLACAVSPSIAGLVTLPERILVRRLAAVGGVVALGSILVGAAVSRAIAVSVVAVRLAVPHAGVETIVVGHVLNVVAARA